MTTVKVGELPSAGMFQYCNMTERPSHSREHCTKQKVAALGQYCTVSPLPCLYHNHIRALLAVITTTTKLSRTGINNVAVNSEKRSHSIPIGCVTAGQH